MLNLIIRRSIATFVTMLAVTPAGSQTLDNEADAKKAREELCHEVLCRPPTTVKVLLKDKNVLEVPFQDASPIVLPNGWVTILAGEEVHIAFDVDGDSVRNPRAVTEDTGEKNTLSFRLSQEPSNADTFLLISSTFEQPLKFDLGMMLPDSDRILKTSSCPVIGGGSLYEHWPHPVFQIFAARFRLIPDESADKCE